MHPPAPQLSQQHNVYFIQRAWQVKRCYVLQPWARSTKCHQDSSIEICLFVWTAGRLRAERRTGTFGALLSVLSSVVSGGQDALAEAEAANLPAHDLDRAVDVEHLDTCHLGHHKYVLLTSDIT